MKEDARWSAAYSRFDPLEVHVRGKERSSFEELPWFRLNLSSAVRWPRLRQLLVSNARHNNYISHSVLSDEPFTLVFDLALSRDEPCGERWILSVEYEMNANGMQSEQVKEFVSPCGRRRGWKVGVRGRSV